MTTSPPPTAATAAGTTRSTKRRPRPKPNGLFISDAGRMTTPSFLLLIAGPIVLSGNYRWGLVLIGVALVMALKAAMENMDPDDKLEIRYNAMSSEDLVAELEQLEEEGEEVEENAEQRQEGKGTLRASATKNDDNDNQTERREKYRIGLLALARKYNRRKSLPEERRDLPLLCQQIAFTTLRLYEEDDEIVGGSISLLALIAKNVAVRKRYRYQTQDYGLDRPIRALQKALDRAKGEMDETNEELLAEILRKGCLYLGAVCNDDKELDLAANIVENDGLELILETGNWFRLHEDVANWSLWAVFTLCFDDTRIKAQLVRLGGIPLICELMKNNPTNLEVTRHGVALLFDLLRENQSVDGAKWDPWEVRKIALNNGLHAVILSAMKEFSDSMDIMMMGQEILIGTAYQGEVPVYQQVM